MSLLPDNNYQNILISLKEKIRSARMRASLKVNHELLGVYWEIGKVILAEQKEHGWGAKIIDKLAADLKSEFPDLKGLSTRNLKYMRAFAEAYPKFAIVQQEVAQIQNTENQPNVIVQGTLAQFGDNAPPEFVQGMLAQLSWYHHITLLDKVKDKELRNFYIQQTVQGGWSRDVMVHQIESGLHQRKGKISSNFKNTIAPDQSELVQQLFNDPYKFEFIYLGKEAKERDLEDALTNQLTKFLLELGQFFSYMGRQYKLMLGEKEYFFDLLFYHTRLKRYIIIDLKIDEFKPEYKGKMEFYLNLADEHLKQKDDEKSIGLILCKTKDGLVVEYALRDSTKPIGIAEYKINELLPENIRGELPSIEELEAEMEKEYEELKSPAQKRFDALKEKLAALKGNEIKQTATTEVLFEIFDKSLLPLYTALLAKMEDFNEMFVSHNYHWQGRNKIEKLEDLAAEWKNEDYLKSETEFYFSYRLNGLKKAGTKAFSEGFQFNYKIETYWYGFRLINYNDGLPLIKKLYGEQLAPQEIEELVDIVYMEMINEIENNIQRIN
jgi:predicted nuclease of restriction endonuclease-like (RecB) superfamily